MPFISFATNNKLTLNQEKELVRKSGELITLLPGKKEENLMLRLEDDQAMYFRGEAIPCMMISVKLYKEMELNAKKIFTEALTKMINEITDIELKDIYVSFDEYQNWGKQGTLVQVGMKKNNKYFDYLLIIIAILAIIYFGILVCTSFFIPAYLFYPLIFLLCGMYGVYELKYGRSLLSRLPIKINCVIKVICMSGILVFVTIEGLIMYSANSNYLGNSDYIIVLGAKLNGKVPSKSLQYRLDATLDYHRAFPTTPIIVSGGKGNNEDISEASAMKDYLVKNGIDKALIIEENQSTNTNENIIYSKKIINPDKKSKITIITNGFHCYRSKLLAINHGLKANTYSAKENIFTAPHYYFREFFGCIKDILFS